MPEQAEAHTHVTLSQSQIAELLQECGRAVDETLKAHDAPLHFALLLFGETQTVVLSGQSKTPCFYVSSAERQQMLSAIRDFIRMNTQ